MFRMHESTIRTLCRLGFVALCLAPTAGVGLLIGWTRTAAFVRQQERSLATASGLEVSIARATLPRPGVTRLDQVVLRERDQHRLVARIDWLEIATSGPATKASAGVVELDGARLDAARELIERILASTDDVPAVWWSVGQIAIETDAQSYSLVDAVGRIERAEASAIATANFRLVDREDAPLVGLRAWRDRQSAPAVIGWEFRATDVDLPCELLALAVPAALRFGPGSTLRGGLWLAETAKGWQGGTTTACRVRRVELESLAGGEFSHAIAGKATIDIASAKVAEGRIVTMEGSVSAAGGIIGTSLLDAAVEQLGCRQTDDRATHVERVGYDRMAWAFGLDERGLTLAGRCGDEPQALIVDAYGPLLSQGSSAPLPVASLVRLLAPTADADVPANAYAASLLRVLPLAAATDRAVKPAAHRTAAEKKRGVRNAERGAEETSEQ